MTLGRLLTKRLTVAFFILTVLMTPCLLKATSNEPSVISVIAATLTK
ncbi:hypothetical protein [Aliirhizobium smilacinae]|jgi:hypothetical protein|nr:hypothetical protein [Rhizobium smilacinae]